MVVDYLEFISRLMAYGSAVDPGKLATVSN